MLRYYVLTSRNFKCLKRHFHSLPKENTTVVINTVDKEYEEIAQQWCWKNKINCVVTESNGMPGKGKNAVLDHFLDSDYKYMVQIDGDDFLQPHGRDLYKWVSENDPPDGIQIVYSDSYKGEYTDPYSQLFAPMPWDLEYKLWMEKEYAAHPEKKEHLVSMFNNRYEYKNLYYTHREQNCTWNYPMDAIHYMDCCRLIFWSRELASKVRFREDLLIGEDSLLNYEVRDLAFRGQCNLKKVRDATEFTYTYDITNCGVTKKAQQDADWAWMEKLNEAIAEREKHWIVPLDFRLEFIEYPEEKRLPFVDIGEL